MQQLEMDRRNVLLCGSQCFYTFFFLSLTSLLFCSFSIFLSQHVPFKLTHYNLHDDLIATKNVDHHFIYLRYFIQLFFHSSTILYVCIFHDCILFSLLEFLTYSGVNCNQMWRMFFFLSLLQKMRAKSVFRLLFLHAYLVFVFSLSPYIAHFNSLCLLLLFSLLFLFKHPSLPFKEHPPFVLPIHATISNFNLTMIDSGLANYLDPNRHRPPGVTPNWCSTSPHTRFMYLDVLASFSSIHISHSASLFYLISHWKG